MKKISLVFFLILILNSVFLFANESSNSDDWLIAVSEFKNENLDAQHKMYQKIVSEMFLIYLSGDAKRLVPFEEKKMRAIMEVSNKKLELIKKRAELIKERDNLFLSIDSEKKKKKKEKKLEKEIKKMEREIYYSKIDIDIEKNKFYTKEKPKNVKLWKNGDALYNYSKDKNLAETLKTDNVAALISGSIKDVSGYMLIRVKLDTGLEGVPVYEFYDAGPYDAVESLVYSLSLQLYSAIQNTKAVKIFFDVEPKNAKLYIDDTKISDFSKPITLYEGIYNVNVSAENYIESSKRIELKDKKAYKLKIHLKKDETVKIGFNFKDKDPYLFYKTQYTSDLPGIVTVPKLKSILEFEEKSKDKTIHSYALFDGTKIGSPEYIQNMIVKLNKKNVKESVELQRKIMYWSLGALYISLPFTMISKARLQDRIDSGKSDKLKTYKALHYSALGVSVALGVNYFIQMVLYFVKADKALPRKIKLNKKNPKFKKLPIKTVSPKNKKTEENNNTTKKDANNKKEDNNKDKKDGSDNG